MSVPPARGTDIWRVDVSGIMPRQSDKNRTERIGAEVVRILLWLLDIRNFIDLNIWSRYYYCSNCFMFP